MVWMARSQRKPQDSAVGLLNSSHHLSFQRIPSHWRRQLSILLRISWIIRIILVTSMSWVIVARGFYSAWTRVSYMSSQATNDVQSFFVFATSPWTALSWLLVILASHAVLLNCIPAQLYPEHFPLDCLHSSVMPSFVLFVTPSVCLCFLVSLMLWLINVYWCIKQLPKVFSLS